MCPGNKECNTTGVDIEFRNPYLSTGQNYKVIPATNWYIAPGYYNYSKKPQEGQELNHDFAILKLKQRVEQNNELKVISLPVKTPPYGKIGYLVGWKISKEGDPVFSIQKVDLISPKKCASKKMKKIYRGMTETQMCAQGIHSAVQKLPTCIDSGGPVFTQEEKGKFILQGIASFAGKCDKMPIVCNDVFHHLDWIQDKMKT